MQIEAIRKTWGFDDSLPQQYVYTMKQVFSGELVSYSNQTQRVARRSRRACPRTFALGIGAAIIWMACGVALGLYSAVRAGRFSDRFLTMLALIGISMPVFWVGALMNYYLGYKAGIFPNGGYVQINEGRVWQWFYHLILPWTALAILFIGVYSRILRSNILDTINEDYVRTARAKGISERRMLTRHVLRNSMIPVITLWGLDFGAGHRAAGRCSPSRSSTSRASGSTSPRRSASSTCRPCSRSPSSARSSSSCSTPWWTSSTPCSTPESGSRT